MTGEHPSSVSKTWRNSGWLFISYLAPAVVAFGLTPTIFESFGAARLGVVALSLVVLDYLSLTDLGMTKAITYHAARVHYTDPRQVARIVSTGILVNFFAAAILTSCTVWWLPTLVARWFDGKELATGEIAPALVITLLCLPAVVSTTSARGALEAVGDFRVIAVTNGLSSVSMFVAPALGGRFGLSSAVVVGLVGCAKVTANISLLVRLRTRIAVPRLLTRPQLNIAKDLVKFGGWTTLSDTVGPLLSNVERVVIGRYLGLALLGTYSAVNQAAFRMGLLTTAVGTVLFPLVATRSSDKRRLPFSGQSVATVTLAAGIVTVGSIVLMAASPDILGLLFGKKMEGGVINAFVLLILAALANGIAMLWIPFLYGVGRTRHVAWLHVVELVMYVPVILLLTRHFGLVGASVGVCARCLADLVGLKAIGADLLPALARDNVMLLISGAIALVAIDSPGSLTSHSSAVLGAAAVAMLALHSSVRSAQRASA